MENAAEYIDFETLTMDNAWMKRVEINGKEFIQSDDKCFFITLATRDADKANYHMSLYDDGRALICTDNTGLHYVVMPEPRQEVTRSNLTKFLKDNRDWDRSIPLLNKMLELFPEETAHWMKHGSTVACRELAKKALGIDKCTVESDNLWMPLDTARYYVECRLSLS